MIKRILLIIGGGIAAYKCLDLIRRLRERDIAVRAVMTKSAHEFVTPLSVGALTNDRVFADLFSLDDEREIGHIRLSREADLLVVAPATADLVAKMAGGHADDLASTVLLATDKPVLIAPAMNPRMWLHPATQRNMATLAADGVHVIGPNVGEMAEAGEAGPGRMAEPMEIVERIEGLLQERRKPAQDRSLDRVPFPSSERLGEGQTHLREKTARLIGRHVLVTSGPTHEPIDPVRYIGNRSSGKQGHAIAQAAACGGARVTLVSGPVALADPPGVDVVHVETAAEMLDAVHANLPADIAVFAAAVADWRPDELSRRKIKKSPGRTSQPLRLVENDDILATVAALKRLRPQLVIGFAAETENVIVYAKAKLRLKGADWIVANDVSPTAGVMGGDRNTVHLISGRGVESWPELPKDEVAARLIARAAEYILMREAVE